MKFFDKLFGTEPFKLVRRHDPVTSFEAAIKVDTSKIEMLVYETIDGFGADGCISDQVLEKLPQMPYSSVTARYKALLDKGFIEITGIRTGKSGRKQRVMRTKRD